MNRPTSQSKEVIELVLYGFRAYAYLFAVPRCCFLLHYAEAAFLKSSCNLPYFEFSSHFQMDGRKEVGFRIQNFSFQSILLKEICLYS